MPASPAQAFDMQAAIVEEVVANRGRWVLLAEKLHTFDAARAWQALGHKNLTAWAGQPEIGLAYRTVKEYIDAWQVFVVDGEIDPREIIGLSVSKLAVVIPAVRAKAVDLLTALADVEALTKSDLQKLYRASREAPIDPDAEPGLEECGQCGRLRVAERKAA